jgi:hypothetical protein
VYFSDFIRVTIFLLLLVIFGIAMCSVFGLIFLLLIGAPIVFCIALL